jgi:alpha-glucosidase (family GH31 glycosyl hydrolase)
MAMSGWAPKDKQAYIYGEPYTSINRKYLKLKLRLTPYMYTLCNEAYETGTPAVRALVLEYPDDTVTRGTETQYEYLLGKNFLVAPVYSSTNVRNNIYLPAGKWFDYWDGTIYMGKSTLNGYSAPLDKLPLFVKAGSIIPMYQQMTYDNERPADTLTLDIYPGPAATFEMFEDEGSNRDYRQGKYTKTMFTAASDEDGTRIEGVMIYPVKGDFKGKLAVRAYMFQLHGSAVPKNLFLNGTKLKKFKNATDFSQAESGWYHNPSDRKGISFVKTAKLPTSSECTLQLKY